MSIQSCQNTERRIDCPRFVQRITPAAPTQCKRPHMPTNQLRSVLQLSNSLIIAYRCLYRYVRCISIATTTVSRANTGQCLADAPGHGTQVGLVNCVYRRYLWRCHWHWWGSRENTSTGITFFFLHQEV